MSLKGKHIILGISGGIAAYKSAMLLRLFIKKGAEVQVVMTPNAKEFITPVTLSSLSGKPVVSEFFTANTGEWHSHVDLGLWADLMVIAPATASTIGKMANGIADNMLITTYLSAKEKVMVAPAMDLDMWKHPSTQRNIATLRADGVGIIEPESGELASGLTGKGRMEEPEKIVKNVEDYFLSLEGPQPLKGKKVMITAGPTQEDIDPVRFLGNRSSGKMGFAIADVAAELGALVTVIAGPTAIGPEQKDVKVIRVKTAREMLEASEKEFEDCDIAILAAAVADYAPANPSETKLKREKTGEFSIRLIPNPDIAATLGKIKNNRLLVGFALETDHELENALSKMERKNLDMIVLNSLRDPEAGFNKDTNKITIYTRNGEEIPFGVKSKKEVAKDILNTLISYVRTE